MAQQLSDSLIVESLKNRLVEIENRMDADCITIVSPIAFGLEQRVFQALNSVPADKRRKKLLIILETGGGIVELVDRMVNAMRALYGEVYFVIPNIAMSAGTVFAMSGDKIFMNYYSTLGPIDPQVMKDGKFIPVLAYLSEYEDLISKSANGQLTTAEFALLNKFDLGELHTFKQAKELSVELLEKWLSVYKFKDWIETETAKSNVTSQMRKDRAKQIADMLMDHKKWHSHSRHITKAMLEKDLNLKIEDYWSDADMRKKVHDYFDVLVDFLTQKGISSFVHSCYFV